MASERGKSYIHLDSHSLFLASFSLSFTEFGAFHEGERKKPLYTLNSQHLCVVNLHFTCTIFFLLFFPFIRHHIVPFKRPHTSHLTLFSLSPRDARRDKFTSPRLSLFATPFDPPAATCIQRSAPSFTCTNVFSSSPEYIFSNISHFIRISTRLLLLSLFLSPVFSHRRLPLHLCILLPPLTYAYVQITMQNTALSFPSLLSMCVCT